MKKFVNLLSIAGLVLGTGVFLLSANEDKVEFVETKAEEGDAFKIDVLPSWIGVVAGGTYTITGRIKASSSSTTSFNEGSTNKAYTTASRVPVVSAYSLTMPRFVNLEYRPTKTTIWSLFNVVARGYYKGNDILNKDLGSKSVSGNSNADYNVTINPNSDLYEYNVDNSYTNNTNLLPSYFEIIKKYGLPNINGRTFMDETGAFHTYGIPTKEGSSFAGLFDEDFVQYYSSNLEGLSNDRLNGNHTLYSYFKNNVSVLLNGGSFSGNYTNQQLLLVNEGYYLNGIDLELPIPFKEGHDFKGWYTNPDFNGDPITHISSSETGDKAIYAKWEIKHFNVNFDTDGGSSVASQLIDWNNLVTKPDDPVKSSTETHRFIFEGWFDASDNEFDFETRRITEVTTIYAKWRAKSFASDEVEGFIRDYMHPEIPFDFIGYGSCSTQGWYQKAKEAFKELSQDAKSLFINDATYAPYVERLAAWAKANGDTLSEYGIMENKISIVSILNEENSNTILPIVILMILLGVGAIYYHYSKRKYNR